jgi:hypothetical protein
MPNFNTNAGSAASAATSIGTVLGTATGVVAGTEVLPRTGLTPWVIYLVIATVVAVAAVLASFVITRVARFFIR